MPDILHRFEIHCTPAQAYAALSRPDLLARWWTRDVHGESAAGRTLQFGFYEGQIVISMEVLELEHEKRISWRCRRGPDEWIGTKVTFEVEPRDGHVFVRFGHREWKELSDHFSHSNSQWAVFLLSLKAFLETGAGKPHPENVWV